MSSTREVVRRDLKQRIVGDKFYVGDQEILGKLLIYDDNETLVFEFDPTAGDLTINGDLVNTNAEIFSHLSVEHWWTFDTNWVDQEGSLFSVDGDNFDNQNVFFEAVMKVESAGKTCYTRIYNITDGAALASSEITSTSQTAERVRSAALTFPSGAKEYKVQFKQSAGGGAGDSANTYACRLVHVQQ